MKPHTGIGDKDRKAVVNILNTILSDWMLRAMKE